MVLIGLRSSSVIISLYSAIPTALSALVPPLYLPIALPSIKPTGWLLNQLNLQANGLAGNLQNFYPLISQGVWQGGTVTYSNLDESEPYHFNALVGTAYLTGNTNLQAWVKNFANHVISTQQSNGWIGPNNDVLWSRYPVLLGMMQLSDAEPSMTSSIVNMMYKFVTNTNSKLQSTDTGLEVWGAVRSQEYIIAMQWLYDNHPINSTTQNMLQQTMSLLESASASTCAKQTCSSDGVTNWLEFFSTKYFPTTGTPILTQFDHGVNLGMALKGGTVTYRYTANQTYLQSTYDRINMVWKYHGTPAGHFAADENLAGLQPWRGAEYCQIVEDIYSMSYNYLILGNKTFADMGEKIMYNSFPAQSTSNMWGHQYLQEPNQYEAGNLASNPFRSDGAYSDVFGLEPNYPCCTVNHGQGLPKFVEYAFMTSADKTQLVQVYHGPFTVSTTLANNNAVEITSQTVYPFDLTVNYAVTATTAFTFLIRVPGWNTGGTITLNGASSALNPDVNGLQHIAVPGGSFTFSVTFGAAITTQANYDGSISVFRGPFTYAIDLGYNSAQLQRPSYFYLPSGTTFSTPSQVVDLQYTQSGTWNVGIDPNTLTFVSGGLGPTSTLPNPVFDHNVPPTYLTAMGCTISGWSTVGNSYVQPVPSNPLCSGAAYSVRLSPWGATKLRIGYIPRVSIGSATTSTHTATTTTRASTSTSSTSGSCQSLYGQCGGQGYSGATTCCTGTCTYQNPYYSQCLN